MIAYFIAPQTYQSTEVIQKNKRMKLRFLGQTYSASVHQVKTVASEQTARFLGQSYTPRLPIKLVKSQLGLRTYRGVSYDA